MPASQRKRTVLEDASDLLPIEPEGPAPARRPGALTGGAVLVVLRAIGGPIWILGFLRVWPEIRKEFSLDAEMASAVLAIIVGAVSIWVVVLLVFGFGVWRGSNTARMMTQAWAALSITGSAVAYFAGTDGISVRATLLTLALDILILLALSSRAARAWTRGKSRRWIALGESTSGG